MVIIIVAKAVYSIQGFTVIGNILFAESLTEEQAKDLANWISIILGKQKVSLVKV